MSSANASASRSASSRSRLSRSACRRCSSAATWSPPRRCRATATDVFASFRRAPSRPGSYTGEHCNIKVLGVNTVVLGRSPMTYAAHAAGFGNCVAAHGDSGGPVYSYQYTYSGGWNSPVLYLDVSGRARGTITAGNFTGTTCVTYNGAVVSGSYEVWYAPVLGPAGGAYIGSLQFYGASLLTL